jgi:hypothetical protein
MLERTYQTTHNHNPQEQDGSVDNSFGSYSEGPRFGTRVRHW